MHVYFYVMYNTYAHCIYNYKGSYILTYFISLLGLNITDNNQVSGFCVPLEKLLRVLNHSVVCSALNIVLTWCTDERW